MRRFAIFAFVVLAAVPLLAQENVQGGQQGSPNHRLMGGSRFGGGLLRGNRLGGNNHSGATGNASAATQPASSPGAEAYASAAAGDDQESDLNFVGADLGMVFKVYSTLVGKTILRDPAIADKPITLKSEKGQKLTKEEQIQAIEMVLEMNDVHLEPYAEKFIRAVPRSGASKEVPTMVDSESLGESGKVASMVVRLNFVSYEEAMKILQEVATSKAKLQGIERTNSILVTDTELNLRRMLDLVKQIDVESKPTEEVKIYQIRNASAADIQQVLQKIVEESQKELDKNGKGVNNNAATVANQPPWMRGAGGGPSMFRRPGQPNQPANNAATTTSSILSSISDADRGLIRGKVVILSEERSNKLVIITSAANHKFFKTLIDELDVETTPETEVKVYRLKYADADEVSDMINDLIGNAPTSKSGARQNQNQNAQAGRSTNVTAGGTPAAQRGSVNKRTGEAGTGELSKDNTTVLADKRINGLVVMTKKELVPVVERIIESMDVKLSQVLIETVIIEVTLGDDLTTGIDWVQRGRQRGYVQETRNGMPLYYGMTEDGTINTGVRLWSGQTTTVTTGSGDDATETTYTASSVPAMVGGMIRDAFVNRSNYGLGGGGGSGSSMLMNVMKAATSTSSSSGGSSTSDDSSTAANLASTASDLFFGSANPIGSGINYILKSDKLNLAAVIQATKSDSRAKYLASPIIMTVDNKEATIDATEARKFFNGYETSSSYSTYVRTPKYDSKDIGIKIKIKPKINPNGTVMLTVEEEYSQLGAGQAILVDDGGTATIDTALTRKMTADVLLDNMQSVVLGGLTETYVSSRETGIPLLKDIPLIGKWLFGYVNESETRKELLVFMTPYVLDDGEAAQVEALRRKKSLSDSKPWEDHGWSLSELADPVSKREQLRRLKDEWKRQDEERKTKLAIEDEKIKRAKALEKMSKEERDHWLELHKEELEKEKKKELERMLQDDDSQSVLKEIAAEVRERKNAEAQAVIDEADAAQRAENERGRIEAEKKAKEAGQESKEAVQEAKGPEQESK